MSFSKHGQVKRYYKYFVRVTTTEPISVNAMKESMFWQLNFGGWKNLK
jgi:hypothetical protein